jgi:predicted AAA+ superfamily ATPase
MSGEERRLRRRAMQVLSLLEAALTRWLGAAPDPETLQRHHAFRWEAEDGAGRIVAIERPAGFDLDDLIGVDQAVERFDRNVRQFLAGLPCNDVLLFGERGTGKSSSVRGVLQRYADAGLRVVEVDRRDLVHLPRILRALRGAHGLRFIVFCDDLSFGPGESGYRELKAALEGSLEAPSENVCIVATSNRRHLVPESMAENRAARVDAEGELHLGEALEEKLALVDRFGLRLGFYNFDQATYLSIVTHYLARAGLAELDEGMRREALRWALERGSRSGRTARQFVDDVAGRRGLGE